MCTLDSTVITLLLCSVLTTELAKELQDQITGMFCLITCTLLLVFVNFHHLLSLDVVPLSFHYDFQKCLFVRVYMAIKHPYEQ